MYCSLLIIFFSLINFFDSQKLQATSSFIISSVMAKDIEHKTLKPLQITSTFTNDQTAFHSIIEVREAPKDTVIKTDWSTVDVPGLPSDEIISSFDTVIEGTRLVHFMLKPEQGKLLPGSYKVDIYINHSYDHSLYFMIESPQIHSLSKARIQNSHPVSTSPYISKVELKGFDQKNASFPFSSVHLFDVDTVLHALIYTENLPEGSKIAVNWHAVKLQEKGYAIGLIAQNKKISKGSSTLDFSLLPVTQWPIGTYKVEILLNEKSYATLNYEIR